MSKYELDDFMTQPDPDLICCICRNVLCRPLESPCQHVFCHDCITTWLDEHRSCPSCRKHLSKSRLKSVLPIVRNMINRLLIRCKNEDRGCNKGVKLESYERHVKECEFGLVGCLNAGCVQNVLRRDMLKHEKECPYRLVKCKKGCGLPVTVAGMREHSCVQSLKNSMQAMEDGFNHRLKDLEDRMLRSHQDLEKRVYHIEKDLDESYLEDERMNDMRRRSYSRSRSRSYSPSRSRSPSRSYSRSRSNSRTHSRSGSHSPSTPESSSPSRSNTSYQDHRESPDDWYRDDYDWEYSDVEERDPTPPQSPNEPWYDDYSNSPVWSERDSPEPQFSPPQEIPIYDYTESTPWLTTRTQLFALTESRASQSSANGHQSAHATGESSGGTNRQQPARDDPNAATTSAAPLPADREQSQPESLGHNRLRSDRKVPPIIITRHVASDSTPEAPSTEECPSAGNNRDDMPGPSQGNVSVGSFKVGSLYGVAIGETDSEDEEWQPEEDASSDSSATSAEDVEDNGHGLSGSEDPVEASTSVGRTTRSSTKRKRRAEPTESQLADRASTSRQALDREEAAAAERNTQNNECHTAEQTSSGRRRHRDRDGSDTEDDHRGRRSKKAKRK